MITIAVWCVAIGLLGRVAISAWQGLQGYQFGLSLLPLTLSFLLLSAAFLSGATGWHLLLGAMAVRNPWSSDVSVWLIAQGAKYLPAGTIWYFGGRFAQARRAGVDPSTIFIALALEFSLYLGAAIALFALSLGAWPGLTQGWHVSLLALAGTALCVFLLPRLQGVLRGSLHRVRCDGEISHAAQRIRVERLRWLIPFYVLQWTLIGVAFSALVASIHPVAPSHVLPLGGAFSLSSATGYLVFLIPGGWGVRESALTSLLTPFVPVSLRAAVAILARLWYTLVEVCCISAGLLIRRARDRKRAK